MELTIQVASTGEAMALFGPGDRNLRLLREAFGVQVTGRGTAVRLSGDQALVERVAGILNGVISLYRSGARVPRDYVEREVEANAQNRAEESPSNSNGDPNGEAFEPPPQLPDESHLRSSETRTQGRFAGEPPAERLSFQGIARSRGQEAYLRAMVENELVFCIGPAGTGKTFLAVRMAVSFLRSGGIKKIILCRPAVEAGEKLGFLPGDLQAKINPYLRPLYDALNDILDYDQVKRFLEREIIEILPLAYMRGRTLNNAFIILDEGQNTSISQMKMFLTRMGTHSRIVVNGDITQVDLPEDTPSGLIHAHKIIRDIPLVAWIEMQRADIVRHPLVKKIVEAYEGAEPGLR